MDQNNIFCSALMLKLTDGFKERLAFNITYCTADLDDSNLSIFCSRITVETALDLICNMRDYLNSSSAEISAAFFLKNGPIDLSCCNIGILCQAFIDKSSRSVSAPSSVTKTSPCCTGFIVPGSILM